MKLICSANLNGGIFLFFCLMKDAIFYANIVNKIYLIKNYEDSPPKHPHGNRLSLRLYVFVLLVAIPAYGPNFLSAQPSMGLVFFLLSEIMHFILICSTNLDKSSISVLSLTSTKTEKCLSFVHGSSCEIIKKWFLS